MDFERYKTDLYAALDATKNWGFDVDMSHSQRLAADELEPCQRNLGSAIQMLGVERLMLNCSSVHATQRYILRKEAADLNPILTLGWVNYLGEPVFQTTRRKLKREIKKQRKKKSSAGIDLHVWLTLQTREAVQVVDFTLPLYLYAKDRVHLEQRRVWVIESNDPQEMHDGLDYYPLLAGQEVLEALNVLDEGWTPGE